MSRDDPRVFQEQMQRVEVLVETIERSADPVARSAAQEIVRALLELHGAALEALLGCLFEAGETGRSILEDCVRDDRIGSVLLLHDLHPLGIEARVRQALERVRPYLQGHGGDVELLDTAEGVVRLRMLGSCQGCPSSAETLRSMIEQSIFDGAPDVEAIEVVGLTEPTAPTDLVQINIPPRQQHTP